MGETSGPFPWLLVLIWAVIIAVCVAVVLAIGALVV